eukprot:TRINITY_DN26296_c0_g1_i1.p1 TRINITY_DN26296_c0_g1~~TRINITY_DN26296_c0_g1_i1.p1  ORF type:complete len:224 (-),score=46.29 TRINITY_DN26296_c0_g1_i1:19-690(-)
MYIILNGTVDVSKPSDDNENEDVLLATLSRGDWFGEQAILTDNCIRSADIITVSTVEVLVLAKGPMMVVLKKCPDILDRLINASNRRTAQNNRISRITSKDPSTAMGTMTSSAFFLGSESSPEFQLMGHHDEAPDQEQQGGSGDTTNGTFSTAGDDADMPPPPVSYTHLRAHETPEHLVCRLLLEKKKKNTTDIINNILLLRYLQIIELIIKSIHYKTRKSNK